MSGELSDKELLGVSDIRLASVSSKLFSVNLSYVLYNRKRAPLNIIVNNYSAKQRGKLTDQRTKMTTTKLQYPG